jgi:hypothetical protein
VLEHVGGCRARDPLALAVTFSRRLGSFTVNLVAAEARLQ